MEDKKKGEESILGRVLSNPAGPNSHLPGWAGRISFIRAGRDLLTRLGQVRPQTRVGRLTANSAGPNCLRPGWAGIR